DHTGQVVARNLVPNSSFELGLNGVTATRNLLLSRTTVSDRVVSGDWSFWPRAQQDITHLSYVRQEVTGLAGGGWLAFRAALRATTGSAREARLRVGFSDGGSRVYEWITSHTNVVGDMRWLEGAAQVPDGYDSARVMIYLYNENAANLSEGASFATDGWIAGFADSEQAALDQVAEYFDGDTPDVVDEGSREGSYSFPFFPIFLADSTVQGAHELRVEGDAPTWPVWEI